MGPNPKEAIHSYKNGLHAYSNTGGGGVLSGDFYGWAAIPPKWINDNFQCRFSVESYIDDQSQFDQAVYIIRKS